MIRDDMEQLSDEEFMNLVIPCENKVANYIKSNFIDEYVSYYIATYYYGNAIWNQPFVNQVKTAIEDFSQIALEDCDLNSIKNILLHKYHLKIVSELPLDIKKVD